MTSSIPTSGRPNILFILTDQQRQDSLACYGNDWIETPNLNRIADRSFVFENAYVTQPVCTPSRASIMTGLYPHAVGLHRNNIPLPSDCPTIAERISEEYYCAYFGKWHLGNDMIQQHGFDKWISVEDFHQSSGDEAGVSERRSTLQRSSAKARYRAAGHKPLVRELVRHRGIDRGADAGVFSRR